MRRYEVTLEVESDFEGSHEPTHILAFLQAQQPDGVFAGLHYNPVSIRLVPGEPPMLQTDGYVDPDHPGSTPPPQ